MARIRSILRRVNVSAKVFDLLNSLTGHEEADKGKDLASTWVNALSAADKQLLHIARAFIASPDVLCLHKPTLHQSAQGAKAIFAALRSFVDDRGLDVSGDSTKRRPRTCIMTCTKFDGVNISDQVFAVSTTGISQVAAHADGSYELSADDLR